MTAIDRRKFVALAAASLPAAKAYAKGTGAPGSALTLHPDRLGYVIPDNFVGLSYETQQLSDPDFFSADNTALVARFRALAPRGVLRLGGLTSDVGWWKPTPDSTMPPYPAKVVPVAPRDGDLPFQKLTYSFTPKAIDNLRGFLDATGWTCIYGLNLGTATPDEAATVASYAAKALGPTLEFFQLGNEVDHFHRRFRDPKTWNFHAYFAEWLASANAVTALVPAARFGMPDLGGTASWMPQLVEQLSGMQSWPDIAEITHHYYFTGPPSNPDANFHALLTSTPLSSPRVGATRDAALKLHLPYRVSECNSCFRGGKPGFSDAFGAALWASDFCLFLASLGYAGFNFHGGGGKEVADSLGGHLPGEALIKDPSIPHPRPFYTPIGAIDGQYVAEPVYFGIKFASHFAGARLFAVDFDPGAVNAKAYGASMVSGRKMIALINKDETKPLPVDLPGYALGLELTAPSLGSYKTELREYSSVNPVSVVPPATAMLLYEA